MSDDVKYMARALELAARGRGRTSPNPMVGCVIVRDGVVLGEGFHEAAGLPHAEVNAISHGHGDIQGATVYVTLEPCAHHGKTPPCADALIAQRPARIVIAMEDPNPLVSGRGIARLRESGIAVEVGALEAQARRLNEAFIKHISTGLPFVTAKCAMTLDGKIATRTGHSQWVTGEAARARVHAMRDEVDAILVGSRTVMLDDPALTARLPEGGGKDPVRVILDAGEYLLPDRKVFQHNSKAPTWIAVTQDRAYDCADDVIRVPKGPGGVDMGALAEELGRRKVNSLLIEGGGTTLASAFEAGIVDKVCFFVAPKIVGGRDAVSPVEGFGATTMHEAIAIDDLEVEKVGGDFLFRGYVRK